MHHAHLRVRLFIPAPLTSPAPLLARNPVPLHPCTPCQLMYSNDPHRSEAVRQFRAAANPDSEYEAMWQSAEQSLAFINHPALALVFRTHADLRVVT